MATYTQRTIRDPRLLQAAIEALDARVTVVGSEGVDEATRQDFMRYFDLYTQRGGG